MAALRVVLWAFERVVLMVRAMVAWLAEQLAVELAVSKEI